MLAKLLPSNPQNADTHPSEFKFLSWNMAESL